MGEIIRKHQISFKNAWNGLRWALITQPNFKVHFILASIAVILGFYLRITYIEWVLLTFTIVWGLSAEMINTAIETMTDLITTEWRKEAKAAKDVAAGMMLSVALGSLIIAIFIFLPKLINKLI